MRTSLTILLVLFLTFSSNAQVWKTDFVEAKKEANIEGKKIILVFQGSDWCAPCIKLDRKIWSSKEFKAYAKRYFVMLKADFPRRKKNQLSKALENKNKILAEKYNNQGYFPLVVVLGKDGNVLGKVGYKNVKPTEYIKILNSF